MNAFLVQQSKLFENNVYICTSLYLISKVSGLLLWLLKLLLTG